MKTPMNCLAYCLFLVLFVSSQAHAAQPAPKTKNATTWKGNMRALNQVLYDLLLDVSSDARFSNPANFKKIEGNAEKLSKLAHDVHMKSLDDKSKTQMVTPDFDPSLPIMSNLFKDETKRAYNALKSGNRNYARSVLKTMTTYCINCHTRTNSGPDFSKLPTSAGAKDFNSLEKADFLSSISQYDQALEEYMKLASDKSLVEKKPVEWERSIRNALVILVRVKRDQDGALKLLKQMLTINEAPEFMLEDIRQWKKSVEDWKGEQQEPLKTEDDLYAEAIRLAAKARSLQKYPADRSAEIYYLRVSYVLHDLLKKAPDGKYAAESLFLLGVSYQALRDLNIWTLHEQYYELCIRKAPHTSIASTCYKQFEQSLYQGYTGSGGTSVPTDAREKLKSLSKLATPEEKTN